MSYKAEIIEAFESRSVKNVYISGVKANKYTINELVNRFTLKKYQAMLNYKIVAQLSRRINPSLTSLNFSFSDASSVLYLKTINNAYPAYGLIIVECTNGIVYTLDILHIEDSKTLKIDMSKINSLVKL